MNQVLPKISIVIAARPDQEEVPAVTAACKLDYPRELLEIIVTRGKQPSVQRNEAVRAAQGDIIYFLDDDSQARPDNLRRIVSAFADPKVQLVGGPNICPPDAPELEQVFALVHSSWLAFAASRARYTRLGKIRESSEKELILCNLAARRVALIELGGFDEALYPNEENALMDELQKRGDKLLHDPELLVYRRPRRNFRSFCKMLFNYGRGRAEQCRLHLTMGSLMNFVPPAWCVYLLLLPVALFLHWWWFLLPLPAYLLAVLLQAVWLMGQGGIGRSLASIPFVALTHILYGWGFWNGLLFTELKPAGARPKIAVKLERVTVQ